jgi:hypothetical protein
MQDHCPAFARHVFAISAVSGGSVGGGGGGNRGGYNKGGGFNKDRNRY